MLSYREYLPEALVELHAIPGAEVLVVFEVVDNADALKIIFKIDAIIWWTR